MSGQDLPCGGMPMPALLPATIESQHLCLPIIWPKHGVWKVWLVDGATDLAIDAEQLVRFLGLDASSAQLLIDFPLSWWHPRPAPIEGEPAEVLLLWSRAAALAVASSVVGESRALAREFEAWLVEQYLGLCAHSPQETLDRALPTRRSSAGEEFPIAAAAQRLSIRYGAEVTRSRIVELMLDLGWVERVDQRHVLGQLRTTLRGRASQYVFSRTVHTPKGNYEQVFVTQAGLAELAAPLREKLEQLPVDVDGEPSPEDPS